MIEESFSTKSHSSISPPKTPPAKRRRKSARNAINGVASIAKKIKQLQHDVDNDDDDGMIMPGKTGNKSAAGTGYAGNTSEDVSPRSSKLLRCIRVDEIAVRPDQSPSSPKRSRYQDVNSFSSGPGISPPPQPS